MAQRLAIWQSSAQKRLGNHQRGESGVPRKAGARATQNPRRGSWDQRRTPFRPFRLVAGGQNALVYCWGRVGTTRAAVQRRMAALDSSTMQSGRRGLLLQTTWAPSLFCLPGWTWGGAVAAAATY